jgi:hypothetical protein
MPLQGCSGTVASERTVSECWQGHGDDVGRDVLEAVGLWLMRLIACSVPPGIDQNKPVTILECVDIAKLIPASPDYLQTRVDRPEAVLHPPPGSEYEISDFARMAYAVLLMMS